MLDELEEKGDIVFRVLLVFISYIILKERFFFYIAVGVSRLFSNKLHPSLCYYIKQRSYSLYYACCKVTLIYISNTIYECMFTKLIF